MLTRSIRILSFTLLAGSLVTPPAWVLCVEPSGEVRMELAGCCDAAPAAAPAPSVQDEDGGCDGCNDVAVFTPGLRAARADCNSPVSPAFCAPTHTSIGRSAAHAVARRDAPHRPAPSLAHLASIVITC